MSSDLLTLFGAAGFAVACAAGASGPARGASGEAVRYEFSFAAASDRLASQKNTTKALADTVDLLARHGHRSEISFVFTGEVPPACLRSLDCSEAMLLRRRVVSLLQALRQSWPPGIDREILGRLSWQAQSFLSLGASSDRDQLRLVLKRNVIAKRSVCPSQVEVLDPKLPGLVEKFDAAAWLAIPSGQAIPVSLSAQLRLVQASQGIPVIEVW